MSTWPNTIVEGKDCIFYIWDAPIWKPYVCARSGSFVVNTDVIETSVAKQTSSAEAALWRTFEPTANSWEASIAGIISLMQTGTLSIADLQLLQFTQTKLLLRYQETSRAGDIYTKEGKAIITASNEDGSFDNVPTFSVNLKGTGPVTQIFTVTPNPSNTCKVKRYDAPGGVGGEDSFSTALLIGKDILEVVKDGLGKATIITSGTPVNIEAKYTSASGTIQFANPFEAGEKAYVLYQDI